MPAFLLIVGLCFTLLAVLAVLLLSWVRDIATSARATARSAERIAELLQARVLVPAAPPATLDVATLDDATLDVAA